MKKERSKEVMIEVDLENICKAFFMPSKSVLVCLGPMGPADLEGE